MWQQHLDAIAYFDHFLLKQEGKQNVAWLQLCCPKLSRASKATTCFRYWMLTRRFHGPMSHSSSITSASCHLMLQPFLTHTRMDAQVPLLGAAIRAYIPP